MALRKSLRHLFVYGLSQRREVHLAVSTRVDTQLAFVNHLVNAPAEGTGTAGSRHDAAINFKKDVKQVTVRYVAEQSLQVIVVLATFNHLSNLYRSIKSCCVTKLCFQVCSQAPPRTQLDTLQALAQLQPSSNEVPQYSQNFRAHTYSPSTGSKPRQATISPYDSNALQGFVRPAPTTKTTQ